MTPKYWEVDGNGVVSMDYGTALVTQRGGWTLGELRGLGLESLRVPEEPQQRTVGRPQPAAEEKPSDE